VGCLRAPAHTLNKQLMLALFGKFEWHAAAGVFSNLSLQALADVDLISGAPRWGYRWLLAAHSGAPWRKTHPEASPKWPSGWFRLRRMPWNERDHAAMF